MFAVSTSNSSAGWMPLSSISGKSSFESKLGHVSALGAGLGKLGCYQIRDSHDPDLELKKVVYDAKTSHERAGDYLPLVPPSIDIPLYVQDAQGRYRTKSGTMKFIYGYVIAATGTKRNGWMAYDALQTSSNCP